MLVEQVSGELNDALGSNRTTRLARSERFCHETFITGATLKPVI